MPHTMAPRSATARAPVPEAGHCSPVPLQETLKGRSGSVSVGSLGPGAYKVLFEASEHLWQVWGLILNAVLYSKLGQSLPMDEAKINKPSSKSAAQVYIT